MDVQNTLTETRPAPRTAEASSTLASDFDTFLTLLTAQMENQDPLNPTDSTEFASQLATFSNVEQNVRTNELLEGLNARMDGANLDALASWIGMEARTTGATTYAGGAITLEGAAPALADKADLVARTPDGTEVGRMPISPDDGVHTVVPRAHDGQPLAPGAYSFAIESTGAGRPMTPVDAARYVPVREALVESGQTVIVLDGGARVPTATISGLRPGAEP